MSSSTKLHFTEKPGYKRFMGYLYGWGASIVIVGALFKINHYPGAGLMLIVGMSIEAIIFVFSAFDKPHPDPQWDRVYPALRNKPDGTPLYEDGQAPLYSCSSTTAVGTGGGSSLDAESKQMLSEKIDEMLKKAEVSPEIFERLSNGIEKLTQTTQSLGQLPDMATVNKDYATQMSQVTEQMTALSDFYKMQVQATQSQVEVNAKLQQDIAKMMETMSGSLESSMKFRQEIDDLSSKVAALNKVYGQMLSAMQNPQAAARA
ncbi:MAG: gliding motility protein GldL [Bacteroidales bacterium]|nr:gliding motility protein GldL [Bacteroidales bacterium]